MKKKEKIEELKQRVENPPTPKKNINLQVGDLIYVPMYEGVFKIKRLSINEKGSLDIKASENTENSIHDIYINLKPKKVEKLIFKLTKVEMC
jgi:hypothetical protein